MVRHFCKFKEVGSKQEALKYMTLLLGKCESAIEQYKVRINKVRLWILFNIFLDIGIPSSSSVSRFGESDLWKQRNLASFH